MDWMARKDTFLYFAPGIDYASSLQPSEVHFNIAGSNRFAYTA